MKNCTVYLRRFTPDHTAQKRCPDHVDIGKGLVGLVMEYAETLPDDQRLRLAYAPVLCRTCTMPVSGPTLWGPSWGGECDRAEYRAAALMSARRRSEGLEAPMAA